MNLHSIAKTKRIILVCRITFILVMAFQFYTQNIYLVIIAYNYYRINYDTLYVFICDVFPGPCLLKFDEAFPVTSARIICCTSSYLQI